MQRDSTAVSGTNFREQNLIVLDLRYYIDRTEIWIAPKIFEPRLIDFLEQLVNENVFVFFDKIVYELEAQ